MLFDPTIEQRGDLADVMLDQNTTFITGLEPAEAKSVADQLGDRFEVYAIKNKPGFVVMDYDQDTLAETVTAETWQDVLDAIAHRAAKQCRPAFARRTNLNPRFDSEADNHLLT